MTLIRVDLPAPLSPTIACTSSGRSLEVAVVQRHDAPETLADAPAFEERRIIGRRFLVGGRDSCHTSIVASVRSVGIRMAPHRFSGNYGPRSAVPSGPHEL